LRLTQVRMHSLARKTLLQNNLRTVFLCVSRTRETQIQRRTAWGEHLPLNTKDRQWCRKEM